MEYTFKELELLECAINVAISELGSGTENREKDWLNLLEKIERDKAAKEN